nr:hydantoinase/carbamoylase family amidase [Salinigranum rubrum]
MNLTLDRDRFVSTMKEQAEIGGTDGGGLHRLTLSDEDKAIRDWFAERMEEEGLETRVDTFGNMFGRREGTDPDAKPVMVGSHLDSQPFGGIYDGALGVIAALEFVRTLNDEGIETTHPIEIVNWTNEEGSRFQPAMQGSGVWAGVLDIEEEYAKTDADGAVFEEELERIGYKGDVPCEPPEEYEAYFELHVEQGPYLEENGKEVGVVTGVVGFTWGRSPSTATRTTRDRRRCTTGRTPSWPRRTSSPRSDASPPRWASAPSGRRATWTSSRTPSTSSPRR